jgi:ATP-dependent Clp protease adaptor protein ClpS
MTEILEQTKTSSKPEKETVWKTIVWDDPVNTMTYVVYVFQKVLQMTAQEAEIKMLEVHKTGKSIVFDGGKEKAEYFAHQLQSFGLQATIEQ